MQHWRILTITALVLAGCGMQDALVEGLAHSGAVADELERRLGLRPQVYFSWNNGVFEGVAVWFSEVPQGLSVAEVAVACDRTVAAEFEATPRQLVIAFAVEPGELSPGEAPAPTEAPATGGGSNRLLLR